jgi:hypothetical protein
MKNIIEDIMGIRRDILEKIEYIAMNRYIIQKCNINSMKGSVMR